MFTKIFAEHVYANPWIPVLLSVVMGGVLIPWMMPNCKWINKKAIMFSCYYYMSSIIG